MPAAPSACRAGTQTATPRCTSSYASTVGPSIPYNGCGSSPDGCAAADTLMSFKTRVSVLLVSTPVLAFVLIGGLLGNRAAALSPGDDKFQHLRVFEDVVTLVNVQINNAGPEISVEEWYYYAGLAYEGLGNRERAMINYEVAVTRNTNFTAAAERLTALRNA